MKTLRTIAFMILMSALLNPTQSQRNPKAQIIKGGQKVMPGIVAPQQPPGNNFSPQLNAIAAMNMCDKDILTAKLAERQNFLNSNGDFAEQLHTYDVARSFIEMDNNLINCASVLIKDQVVTPVKGEEIKPAPDTVFIDKMGTIPPPEDCTNKITYIAVASGSLLLVLLLALIKFMRAHKIFKDLYEKVYDKVLDEVADKLLVAAGIKEDEKLKEKIKKLVELNKSRKKGELKLDEYCAKVEAVLE